MMDAAALKSAVIGARIRGYASVYDVQDSRKTTVDQGAFGDWLSENRGKQVDHYWNHRGDNPLIKDVSIGRTTIIREDSRGLYYEGNLFISQPAINVIVALAGGSSRYASVGFNRRDKRAGGSIYIGRDGKDHLRDLELGEISIVPWPSNDQTTVELVDAPILAKLVSGLDIYASKTQPESARSACPDIFQLFAKEIEQSNKRSK